MSQQNLNGQDLGVWRTLRELFRNTKSFYALLLLVLLLGVFIALAALAGTKLTGKDGKPLLEIYTAWSRSKMQNTDQKIYLNEQEPITFFANTTLSADVITLDSLSFDRGEISILKKLKKKHSNSSHDIENLINSKFNTMDVFIGKKYPHWERSFIRVKNILEVSFMRKYYAVSERKKALLSDEFWDLNDAGCQMVCLPKEIQHSVVVITINNAPDTCFLDSGNVRLEGDIRRAVREDKEPVGILPNKVKKSKVCLFTGESIHFKHLDEHYSIKVEQIINESSWKGGKDLVVLSWVKNDGKDL